MSCVPVAFSLLTNASPVLNHGPPLHAGFPSWPPAPPKIVWKAPEVVGKSIESVNPVTYALPLPSIAIADATSSIRPPRYVEYNSWDPDGLSFSTNASPNQPTQELPPAPANVF